MRKYGIQSSILTIDANEEKTQEKAKEAAEGKQKNEKWFILKIKNNLP